MLEVIILHFVQLLNDEHGEWRILIEQSSEAIHIIRGDPSNLVLFEPQENVVEMVQPDLAIPMLKVQLVVMLHLLLQHICQVLACQHIVVLQE